MDVQHLLELIIVIFYFAVLILLSIYGIHRGIMVYLYWKYRGFRRDAKEQFAELPAVTVQLPVYNEMYVVERLIDAVCGIEYPVSKFEVQVLDDSTDETQNIARAMVERYQNKGFNIHYIHRTNRTGYKAGALAEGLMTASGEFVAVFDADFIPTKETLQKTIHYFTDPQIGMVQVRWGHVNSEYSLLTKIQSIMLDGHFVIEHTARNLSGRFFNFNGTAGIWRKEAILSSGGWQHDTLTEDLDLSYRAQMKGWRFLFVPDVISPAEVPVEINSFKSQQHRWAKGSIQTCRKLLPAIFRSNLPWWIKVESFFHLSSNISYVLMMILSFFMLPSLIIRYEQGWQNIMILDLPIFLIGTMSVTSFYFLSQKEVYNDWWARIKYIPLLMSLGIGLSVNNSKAVLEALFGYESEFKRTPKYCIEKSSDNWEHKKYKVSKSALVLVELAFAVYFAMTIYYAILSQLYFSVPFLMLFFFGFSYMSLISLAQASGGWVILKQRPVANVQG
ncbi:MAG: glycosyl transferase family 2 [Acidobacteria bacterium]|nr:MAG: glycosyl transferase family 2 [Acidobacteriota bacterium]